MSHESTSFAVLALLGLLTAACGDEGNTEIKPYPPLEAGTDAGTTASDAGATDGDAADATITSDAGSTDARPE